MKANIPTIPPARLDEANSGRIGVEFRVYMALTAILFAGEADFTDVAAASWTPDNAYTAPALLTEGREFQISCNGPVISATNITAQFNVEFAITTTITILAVTTGANVSISATAHGFIATDHIEMTGFNEDGSVSLNGRFTVLAATDADNFTIALPVTVAPTFSAGAAKAGKVIAGTASAIMQVPARVQNQIAIFPPGLGRDLKGDGANSAKKIRRVLSVATVTGGQSGDVLAVICLPDDADFALVACGKDKTWGIPTPESVDIPCGYNGARWVKAGRSEPPTLEIKANYAGYGDGLGRFNGVRATAKLETWVNDTLLVERLYFGGWISKVNFNAPDGNGEAEATGTGKYETFAAFV